MLLATWNIQWGRGVDGRVDLNRIVAQLRRLGDADVVLLQEVADGYPELPGADGGDQFAQLAMRLPGYTIVEGPATDTPRPGGGRRRFGNLVASRLPVLQAWRHLLPWPADPAVKSMQRGIVEAVIDAGWGRLRVASTHLEYYSPSQRLAQVERLRELHRQAAARSLAQRPGASKDGPFDVVPDAATLVLAGDFNCTPDSAERRHLHAPFGDGTPALHDAWRLLHGDPPPPTVGVHDREQWADGPLCFDAFVIAQDLLPRVRRVEVDARADGSDHQPMLLELAD